MHLKIRAATVQDHEQIRKISRSLGRRCDPERWGEDECQLIAQFDAAAPIAWARAHWWDPRDPLAPAGYYLAGVEVAAEYQRRSVAAELSAARLRWIARRDTLAWCVVNRRNHASRRLQESLGFTEAARAASFGSIEFTGGEGILFRRDLSDIQRDAAPYPTK